MKKKLIIGILSAVLLAGVGAFGVVKGIEVYKNSVHFKTKKVNEIIESVPKTETMDLMYDEEDNTVFVFAQTQEGLVELATDSAVGFNAWNQFKNTMIDYNKELFKYISLSEIENVNVHTIITNGETKEEIAEIRNGEVYSDSIKNIKEIREFYNN